MDKIKKTFLAHVVELALTHAQRLSCDVLPNRSVMATIGVIRKLGLRQDQRFGIAQRMLELNKAETVPCMREFRLSQGQRFELAKIFIRELFWVKICPSFNFSISLLTGFLMWRKMCAVQNDLTAYFGKTFSSLPSERRYLIAKLCAEQAP